MNALTNLAREILGGCALMEGRTKLKTPDVIGRKLTLRDFELLNSIDKDGTVIQYPVVIFDEEENGFYCGGKALSELCAGIENGGLHDDLRKDGLKISLMLKQTRKGQTFVSISVEE